MEATQLHFFIRKDKVNLSTGIVQLLTVVFIQKISKSQRIDLQDGQPINSHKGDYQILEEKEKRKKFVDSISKEVI